MKRGFASLRVHSALAITRRSRLQLLRVDQVSSLNRRAGWPVVRLSSRAITSSAPIARLRRTFLASPKMKSTLLASHQVISASRAKPESARTIMRAIGQLSRICATIRAISSTAPAAASMLAGRSLVASQITAAEDVQRQIAVAIVIAVEEPPLLVPVQRVVGGVEINDNLLGRGLMRLQKQCHEQPFDTR